jgi:uncharacterized protein (DUF1800 family)
VNGLDLQEQVRSAPESTNDITNDLLLLETQQAALLRAVYSRHQLRETMADFWTNHFNIYALKNNERELVPLDTETVLRPHILGKFRDMLIASAHSPAMLSYLDNQQNKKGVANENYARELLELHTLGVKSGYTQKDIQEVARCFTGWRLRTPGDFQLSPQSLVQSVRISYQGFCYDARLHDNSEKRIPFLNLRLPAGGGEKDADTVLERLVMHEATATFLAQKLCRRYLGQEPPEIIARAKRAYLQNDTSVRAMLRPILLDGLTQTQPRPIFKRPLDFVVSALRAMSADTDGGEGVQRHLLDMGQPLYQWPMPDGFPEKGAAWTGSLLGRWNFSLALASGQIANTSVALKPAFEALGAKEDPAKVRVLIETLLNLPADSSEMHPLAQKIESHLQRARQAGLLDERIGAEAAALVLASPAFQWK